MGKKGERVGDSGYGDTPLASHGVSLVGHGAGPNLILLEWFLHLLLAGEEANVCGYLVSCCPHPTDRGEHVQVLLTCVRLPSHYE